jgi:hypothetical protein
MPMLHSCPRCSQVLPSAAMFCRRCGAAVEMGVRPAVARLAPAIPPPLPLRKKSGSRLSAVLVVCLLGALTVGFLGVFRVHSASQYERSMDAVRNEGVYQYTPPPQPVYSPPVIPHYPVYVPPVVVHEPVPERYPDRYPAYRTDSREHAR